MTPPRDDLDRPVTQRQFLHFVELLRKNVHDERGRERTELWRHPHLRVERALELTWEQLTVELRQEARAAHCQRCGGTGLVCEDHPSLPWGGVSTRPEACHCGGAGVLCPCSSVAQANGVDKR